MGEKRREREREGVKEKGVKRDVLYALILKCK